MEGSHAGRRPRRVSTGVSGPVSRNGCGRRTIRATWTSCWNRLADYTESRQELAAEHHQCHGLSDRIDRHGARHHRASCWLPSYQKLSAFLKAPEPICRALPRPDRDQRFPARSLAVAVHWHYRHFHLTVEWSLDLQAGGPAKRSYHRTFAADAIAGPTYPRHQHSALHSYAEYSRRQRRTLYWKP